MKTAERILLTALTLFNERGENSVTSVDLAMELDISPGNLYYHYKGKGVIVAALIALHSRQIKQLLDPKKTEHLTADDFFYYLFLLIEKLHLFRFIYRSPADIAEKYPEVSKQSRLLITAIQQHLGQLLMRFSSSGHCRIDSDAERTLMVELIGLVLTQSCQYDSLLALPDDNRRQHHALSLLIVMLLPRFTLDNETLAEIQRGVQSQSMHEWSQDKQHAWAGEK